MHDDPQANATNYADHYTHTATHAPDAMDAFWMPFSANRQFKSAPRLMASASGMFYRTVDGREVLDATGGLWCCNAGHARPRIVQAVQQQIATLDFAPTFQMGHPLPFTLAERLVDIAPDHLNHVFFTNSGSESVDTALKYAYVGRRRKKRDFRRLWVTRINAAARENGLTYGQLIAGLKAAGNPIDRKHLAELAVNSPAAFAAIAKTAAKAKPAPARKRAEARA